ncbi:unnamed protein product [Choristocarpus tenellus]
MPALICCLLWSWIRELHYKNTLATPLFVAFAVLGVAGETLLEDSYPSPSGTSILKVIASQAFDWSKSTTPAPISTTAVLAKRLLTDRFALSDSFVMEDGVKGRNDGFEDIPIAPVRLSLTSEMLSTVQELCETRGCDPNEIDPEFGTTPLHLAELWGDTNLTEYLLSIGADPDAYDSVGRQPSNMSFLNFSINSKVAAVKKGGSCEIPEVVIPIGSEVGQDEEDSSGVERALAEVRRLVSEGEPVMVRNAGAWLDRTPEGGAKHRDSTSFIESWGHRMVDVGSVPYARVFNLGASEMTLKGFADVVLGVDDGAPSVQEGEVERADESPNGATNSRGHSALPKYVFQLDSEACKEGYDLMDRFVRAALPTAGPQPLVCPPPSGQRGLDSVHYYIGGENSGAPFHIHSDAINLLLSGTKRWWMVTPRQASFSRQHISAWVDGEYPGLSEEERPMECVQGPGDIMYVPSDWGHAAMNLEDGVFGYTLELLNRRDTLASVLGVGCE